MARRKRAKRQHRLIGFKAYTDTDADLLAWWESIPTGERSETLRELLRLALGYAVQRPHPTRDSDLTAVQEELAWLRQALADLPGYVQQAIQTAAETGVLRTDVLSDGAGNEVGMSDADAVRREGRMKKTRW